MTISHEEINELYNCIYSIEDGERLLIAEAILEPCMHSDRLKAEMHQQGVIVAERAWHELANLLGLDADTDLPDRERDEKKVDEIDDEKKK